MIQAITYMTYWFTVAKTGQTKTFHQICICLKAMQQISLVLGHRLPGHGVYGEQDAESIHKLFRLLQRAYCSMQAATICLQVMLKKNIIARLVHPGAKALKSGIIKRK